MPANSLGERFVITSFGESHGPALGVVIDGCPAGVPFDAALLSHWLERRRPGAATASGAVLVSARREPDEPEILSGVYEGRTLGTPIAILVRNRDARSADYAAITHDPANSPRRGHADDLFRAKFGHSDARGGGRASGRETVARVMAGAVAQMLLRTLYPSLRVLGFARRIATHDLPATDLQALAALHEREPEAAASQIDAAPLRFPVSDQKTAAAVVELITQAKHEGKSYGGLVELWIDGAPQGLGQPVFHKLKADLAQALFGVGATSGVELGAGFLASAAEGVDFHGAEESPYGGIRGGISTGERIVLRVAMKPPASVLAVAQRGRHDPCIVPRAIPVFEAMLWLTLAEHALWALGDRIEVIDRLVSNAPPRADNDRR